MLFRSHDDSYGYERRKTIHRVVIDFGFAIGFGKIVYTEIEEEDSISFERSVDTEITIRCVPKASSEHQDQLACLIQRRWCARMRARGVPSFLWRDVVSEVQYRALVPLRPVPGASGHTDKGGIYFQQANTHWDANCGRTFGE